MTTCDKKSAESSLRQRAEKLAAQAPVEIDALSKDNVRDTLHELRVHQIEMEMQNEDLRQTRAKLDALLANYFDLYNLAPLGYVTTSKEGLILETNLTFVNLLGLVRNKLIGKPLSQFILKEDQEIYHRYRKNLLLATATLRLGSVQAEQTKQDGQPQTCELRLLKKDGTSFWARLDATPVSEAKDDSGQEEGAPLSRITLLDITESKRAVDALQKSEETFRILIENSFDVIFTLDTEGIFVFVSPAWERHFGYQASDVIGISFAPFVHPDDLALLFEYLERVMTTGQSETSPNYRVKHANGGWILFIANGTAYVNAQGERQFIGVGHDITAHKLAEDNLCRQAEELRIKNEELTRFNSVAIGRELRMVELKREINELCAKLGEPPRHKIATEEQE